MKVAAVVPMKLNNRRLPQKNTKPFTNGRPLCWYILSTLLEVEAIEKVYVYCPKGWSTCAGGRIWTRTPPR